MLSWWSYLTFAVVIAALLFAVWKVWRVQICVWLIPKSEIEKAAEDLIRLHGIDNSERKAMAYSVSAWQRHDPIEAGRWDRVAYWLQQNTKKKLSRN